MGVATRTRTAAALLAVGALAACGSSSSPRTGPTPGLPGPSGAPTGPEAAGSPSVDGDFVESFDDNSNDWPTLSERDGTTLAVTDGQYRITMPAASIRYIRPAALSQRDDVRRNVTLAARVSASGKTYAYGLACRMSPGDKQYYVGRVFNNGTSAIAKRRKGERADKVLGANSAQPVDLATGKPADLALTCDEKNGTISITFKVNGRVTVEVDDSEPLPDNAPGIYVVAGVNSTSSSFAFDDVVIGPAKP